MSATIRQLSLEETSNPASVWIPVSVHEKYISQYWRVCKFPHENFSNLTNANMNTNFTSHYTNSLELTGNLTYASMNCVVIFSLKRIQPVARILTSVHERYLLVLICLSVSTYENSLARPASSLVHIFYSKRFMG